MSGQLEGVFRSLAVRYISAISVWYAEANILAQTAGVPSIPWSGEGLEANLGPDGTIPEEKF